MRGNLLVAETPPHSAPLSEGEGKKEMSKKMKKPPLGLVLDNAKNLRRNMTDAEKLMWRHLRDRRFENLKFRRQHPIPPYIADFFCEELNMVIELDGG